MTHQSPPQSPFTLLSQCWTLSAGSQPLRTRWIILHLLAELYADIFGKSAMCATCTQVAALCINHWLIYCNRANAVYINIGYLFNHTFTYKHRYTHLFTHPRRHTNTRRPINLLFDSGFNLLSATPLAGPASQLSGNKEAGVWWRGSNRQQHHKSCLSLFEPRCPCTCVQGRELKICWILKKCAIKK